MTDERLGGDPDSAHVFVTLAAANSRAAASGLQIEEKREQ